MGGKVRPGYWKDLYRTRKFERRTQQKRAMSKNKEYYQGYFNDYYRKNWARCVINRLRARAKRDGLEFNLALLDLPPIPKICPVLGLELIIGRGANKVPLPNSPSVDRIDPKKGYIKGNIRVISYRANSLKSNASLEELEAVVKDMRYLALDAQFKPA